MIKNRQYEILLWLVILVYIILFSYLSIHRLYAFNSHYFDLGIMDQVVYNTSQGRFLEMTNQDFGKNISRLAIHFDPILALLSPFYKIYNGPETLLVLQSICLGLGAWAVFLMGRGVLKNKKASLILAISYLFYFPVERANLFDFHPVVLATPLLLFMIYFSLKRKFILMYLMILLSLLTKEHTGLVVLFFGLYLLWKKSSFAKASHFAEAPRDESEDKEKKHGLVLIIIGAVFFITTVSLIIPYFRQESHFALKYFSNFGDSPKSILIGLVKNPWSVLLTLLKVDRLNYIRKLLLQHGIFVIFSPIQLLVALPEIMINALSSTKNMRNIYFHYNSLTVPFVLFSAVYGLKIMTEKISKKYQIVFWIIFWCSALLSIYFYNPLPLKFLKQPYWWGKINTEKLNVVRDWQNKLGDSIKVASTPKLAPFFTGRKFYLNFLFDPAYAGMKVSDNDIISKIDQYNLADYVVINTLEVKTGLAKRFYENLVDNSNYVLVFNEEEIEIYKRKYQN